MDERIFVVGSGAIGGLYGGKLAAIGLDVSFLCRSDYEVVKSEGLFIKSVWGDFRATPARVVKNAEELNFYPDYILVCLKVLPQIDVPSIIRPAVGDNTAICLIQNGIDIEPPVQKAFPSNEIISGLAFVCCHRTAPGQIEHLDYGRLVLGNYPKGTSKTTEKLADIFRHAGIPCTTTDDVVGARWQKLVWNAPFNPISVLAGGVTTDEMLSDTGMKSLIRAIMDEVCRLAEKDGHPLPSSVIDENISFTETMTPYKTSMLLDFESKRPMEVEAILGNAVRKGKELGVAIPHIETLYRLLKMVDMKNRENGR
ncbi:MAG: 2-dehydropantoate 2-reductase [Deltaproteobacteria bacterium]|nr:2-dehydropantoate 2-reductase [Deltaproteobacteria bacterium]MBW2068500.1 2-dehydropantoate 2-reductase [Deltaproteobacteria bacterium]